MSGLDLPEPVVRHEAGPPVDVHALPAALGERVDGGVRFDAGSRAAYPADASGFRQTPIGVGKGRRGREELRPAAGTSPR